MDAAYVAVTKALGIEKIKVRGYRGRQTPEDEGTFENLAESIGREDDATRGKGRGRRRRGGLVDAWDSLVRGFLCSFLRLNASVSRPSPHRPLSAPGVCRLLGDRGNRCVGRSDRTSRGFVQRKDLLRAQCQYGRGRGGDASVFGGLKQGSSQPGFSSCPPSVWEDLISKRIELSGRMEKNVV